MYASFAYVNGDCYVQCWRDVEPLGLASGSTEDGTASIGFVEICLIRMCQGDASMRDVPCTAQIGYSWDSLGIQGAGVRNYSSLNERGSTTS